MRREGQKVYVESLHISGHMRYRLRPVHQHQRAGGVRFLCDLPQGSDRPQYVGHLGNSHQLDRVVDQPVKGSHITVSVFVNRDVS